MKQLTVILSTILLLFSLCACSQIPSAPEPTPCPHDWELVRTVPATCTEDGHEDFQCTLCGESFTNKTDEATGHVPALKYPSTRKPTCTKTGYQKQKCDVCGEEYEVTLPIIEHNYKDHICTMCGAAEKPLFFTDMKLFHSTGSEYMTFTANINNYTGKTIEFVKVTLELMDDQGNIIDSDWTYAVGSEGLKDRAKAYFDIYYRGVSYYDVKSWSLSVTDYDFAD